MSINGNAAGPMRGWLWCGPPTRKQTQAHRSVGHLHLLVTGPEHADPESLLTWSWAVFDHTNADQEQTGLGFNIQSACLRAEALAAANLRHLLESLG